MAAMINLCVLLCVWLLQSVMQELFFQTHPEVQRKYRKQVIYFGHEENLPMVPNGLNKTFAERVSCQSGGYPC